MENMLEWVKINTKWIILKKIKVSSIVHFFYGKYSFSLDTFWIYLVLIWKFGPEIINNTRCINTEKRFV